MPFEGYRQGRRPRCVPCPDRDERSPCPVPALDVHPLEAHPAATLPRVREVPKPPPGYVPGQKRAKHLRNARIATGITIAALVLGLGFGAWFLVRGMGSSEDPRVRDTR